MNLGIRPYNLLSMVLVICAGSSPVLAQQPLTMPGPPTLLPASPAHPPEGEDGNPGKASVADIESKLRDEKQKHGEHSPLLIPTLKSLADRCVKLRLSARATQTYLDILDIHESARLTNYLQRIKVLEELIDLHEKRGDWEEIDLLMNEHLPLKLRALPELSSGMEKFAWRYAKQGKHYKPHWHMKR